MYDEEKNRQKNQGFNSKYMQIFELRAECSVHVELSGQRDLMLLNATFLIWTVSRKLFKALGKLNFRKPLNFKNWYCSFDFLKLDKHWIFYCQLNYVTQLKKK